MNLRVLAWVLLASHFQSAMANDVRRPLLDFQSLLPANTPHCSGHVSGAPAADGHPGMHISWQAYGVDRPPAELTSLFNARLSAASRAVADGCTSWRMDDAGCGDDHCEWSLRAGYRCAPPSLRPGAPP